MASATCCWAATSVPAAGIADLLFDPRAARVVKEPAGPDLAQEAADLTAGPPRMVLEQQREWFVR
eukprot:11977125-Alexandrium_andersonii.AAC.1